MGADSQSGLIEHPKQQLHPLEHESASLQMPTPDLTGAIREAEMQMGTLGRHCAIEGDDLEISLKHGGVRATRALKSSPAQVPHHAKHKSGTLLLPRQGFQRQSEILAWSQCQRQRSHPFSD